MCRDSCSVEAHRSHSIDSGVLSSKRFPAQSVQSAQPATQASRQGAQIDRGGLALVPARSRSLARLDRHSNWHHPGAAWTLVFRDCPRNIHPLGSGGCTSSSRRRGTASRNQGFSYWTQMGPSSDTGRNWRSSHTSNSWRSSAPFGRTSAGARERKKARISLAVATFSR
jgi:hypothetical protein